MERWINSSSVAVFGTLNDFSGLLTDVFEALDTERSC